LCEERERMYVRYEKKKGIVDLMVLLWEVVGWVCVRERENKKIWKIFLFRVSTSLSCVLFFIHIFSTTHTSSYTQNNNQIRQTWKNLRIRFKNINRDSKRWSEQNLSRRKHTRHSDRYVINHTHTHTHPTFFHVQQEQVVEFSSSERTIEANQGSASRRNWLGELMNLREEKAKPNMYV